MNNVIGYPFLSELEKDYNDLKNTGKIQRVTKINEEMRINDKNFSLRDDLVPAPFYGNFNSPYVTINYNPGYSLKSDKYTEMLKDFNKSKEDKEYMELLYNYDKHYDDPTFYSIKDNFVESVDLFDLKRLPLLIPFDQIENHFEFKSLASKHETYRHIDNLKKLATKHCQIEFLPYGSAKFHYKYFTEEFLKECLERLLVNIFAAERKVVIFNGNQFSNILSKFGNKNIVIGKQKKFNLIKKDGLPSSKKYSYTPVSIEFNGKKIKCIIANSFAMQGFQSELVEQYANEIIKNEF